MSALTNNAILRSVYDQVNGVIKTSGSGGGGGGSGVTQAEVTAAIEDATNIDQIANVIASIAGYVDTLETLIGTTNTNTGNTSTTLTTIAGYVDTLETLVGTSNTNTSAIASNTTLENSRLPVGNPAGLTFVSDLTLDTSAYADGDVLSDGITITNAVRASTLTSLITDICVIDKSDQGQPFEILFFSQSITLTGAKNAAWAVSNSDMDYFLGIVSIGTGDYIDLGSNRVAHIRNLGLQIKNTASSTSVFMYTRSRGTGTYSVNGLRVKVGIVRD